MGKQELRFLITGDARKFQRSMAQVKAGVKTAAKVIGAVSGAGFIKATKDALEFEKQMAEVGTIGGFSKKELESMGKQLLTLGAQLGATTEELTGGLYQALSASVPADNAITFLETAVKSAKAGVTDTETAVDGLTTIINAYGLSATEAGNVSDKFFQTVKLGKTTFGELSENIGKTAALASTAGVSIDELFAATASLTKQGKGTDIAMTEVKGAITALLKPTPELAKAIKLIGSESGLAAIKQHGFQGTLERLSQTVGGNADKMAGLFTNVRALNAAVSLTGSKAALAATDLDKLKNATGATDAAFAIMADTSAQSVAVMLAQFKKLSITVGNEIMPQLKAEVDKLNTALATPEGGKLFQDVADTAKGALEVVKALVGGIGEISSLLKLPEIGEFIGGKFGIQRDAADIIGTASTPEQIAAFRAVKESGELLAGPTSVQGIVQSGIIEKFLQGGSTESLAVLQNIQKTLDGRLPAVTEGATQ